MGRGKFKAQTQVQIQIQIQKHLSVGHLPHFLHISI